MESSTSWCHVSSSRLKGYNTRFKKTQKGNRKIKYSPKKDIMVTYIFGAGASAESIPVASNLHNSINSFYNNLKEASNEHDNSWIITLPDNITILGKNWIEKLAEKSKCLLIESQYHQTIDTYAKMLHLTKQYDKYKDLKAVLCCYFYWIQSRTHVARRYDHFIASIIDDIYPGNRQSVIPDEIRIISWNYDLQFEMALSKYLSPFQPNCQGILSLANITTEYSSDFYNSTVTKINGCCLLDPNSSFSDYYELPYFDENDYERISLEQCIKIYYLISSGQARPLLNFAWENRSKIEAHLKSYSKLNTDIFDTEYLVIIGYSFPFFNRQIDRSILNNMTKLKKVYVQCPEGRSIASKIKSFIAKDDVECLPVEDMSQFFLPPEL